MVTTALEGLTIKTIWPEPGWLLVEGVRASRPKHRQGLHLPEGVAEGGKENLPIGTTKWLYRVIYHEPALPAFEGDTARKKLPLGAYLYAAPSPLCAVIENLNQRYLMREADIIAVVECHEED